MTGMGHSQFGGRFCLEMAPVAYDRFFNELQSILTTEAGTNMPPINECAWWATLALDFDLELSTDVNVARTRRTHAFELARLFVQELEMHFSGYQYASAVVAVSRANRYRFYFPGVPYIGLSAVLRLLSMVKAKVYNDADLKQFLESLDLGPTKQRHLRVHGTIGVSREGGDKPASKYSISGVVRDSTGFTPSRVSIRPDADAYDKMLREPENAYLRCCSTFVGAGRREREEESFWTVDLLGLLFRLEEDRVDGWHERRNDIDDDNDEESSRDSVFGDNSDNDDDERRSEPIALLISPMVVVAEYNNERCLMTAHGYRSSSATVYYSNGIVKIINGLDRVQLADPVDQNDPALLTGIAATTYTEQRRQPQIVDMRTFPVSLFCYRNGISRVTSTYDEEEGEGKVEWHYEVTDDRQVRHPLDTANIAKLLAKSCSIAIPPTFNVTNATNIVNDSTIARFSDAFDINSMFTTRHGTEVLQIEAGCGVGKTIFALKLIERLSHARANFSVLCVTPRAQLCAQLATKFESVAGLQSHLYNDGEWPEDKPVCVVTVDSLVKCVAANGVGRQPTLVLLDEVELTSRHIGTSETLSTTAGNRLRTLETLLILLANSRYVIAMDAQFGFSASMLLSMVALKRITLGDHRSLHYRHLQLIDNRVRQQYCVIADDYRRYSIIRDSMVAGRNVIVFESSPRKATALLSLLEPHLNAGKQSLLLHGKTDAETKRMFSTDPSAYLRVNNVQLLIHTSSIGVGVSIDDPHFHEAHVAFRPHMTDEAAVQASHRARHLQESQLDEVEPPREDEEHQPQVPSAVREVYVQFDKRMRFSEHQLQSIRTVGDAIASFERRISLSRELYRRYADFAQISVFDARVTVRPNDPNTLFVAALLASTEMAVNIQGVITVTRVFDDSVTLRFEGIQSSPDDLRLILDAERSVEFDMSVLPTDSARTRSQKTHLVRAIGYDLQEGLGSKQFMGRLTFGMSHPSNLRRFASLIVLLRVDNEALNLHVQNVLENVTETMPLYAQDDARGVTVGVEALAVAACLKAFDVDISNIHTPQILPYAPNWQTEVANFTGSESEFHELFELIQRRFRGSRWSKYKQCKTDSARVRRFINSFFGGTMVNTRNSGWDARQIGLSAELVPGYCRAQQIDLPEEVVTWCEQFNGTWSRFIADEANGVHQKSVY